MARSTRRDGSNSEDELEYIGSAKKAASTTRNASNNKGRGDDVTADGGEEGSEDDEEEEEYEIQTILDAKPGVFEEGRYGYLVKWKGYDEEHNSWVDERDAGGAQQLIDDWWLKHKKGGQRKLEPKAKTPKSAMKPRKSAAAKNDDSDVEMILAPPKKRGRPSKAATNKSDGEQEEDEAPKKKPRKSTGAAAGDKRNGKRNSLAGATEASEDTFADMDKWKNANTWEHLVQSIDTVERSELGELYVYFTLVNERGHAREKTDICRQKMPYKLLDFYESNLRWKRVDENAMEDAE